MPRYSLVQQLLDSHRVIEDPDPLPIPAVGLGYARNTMLELLPLTAAQVVGDVTGDDRYNGSHPAPETTLVPASDGA
jgi:hypothetical protein